MRVLTFIGTTAVVLLAVTIGCGGGSEFIGAAAEGEKLVEKYGCRDCHVIRGEGADKAPTLDTVIVEIGEVRARKQIKDPKANNPNSVMPDFGLSEKEQDQILAYLREIQE
ncbi:MAG: cytochrome c [Candidatus Coatesbacteria bacterium]|nr:MAG: cytochrome c [Candidatus Coatesbacteria bacterium]